MHPADRGKRFAAEVSVAARIAARMRRVTGSDREEFFEGHRACRFPASPLSYPNRLGHPQGYCLCFCSDTKIRCAPEWPMIHPQESSTVIRLYTANRMVR